MDKAGSQLVVIFLYTRSCGACKQLLADFQALCEEAARMRTRAVFVRHNLLNEFDYWSDVSVFYRTRVVPCILFVDHGAVVKRLTLHDVRRMGEAAPTIREAMARDLAALREVFRQTLFEKAPGAQS